MLGVVDSFFDRQLAFLWESTMPHYWLTCFSVPMGNEFFYELIKEGKRNLLESSISHIVILTTLSLSLI